MAKRLRVDRVFYVHTGLRGDDPKLFKRGTFETAANHVTTRLTSQHVHCGSSSGSSAAIAGYDVRLVTANRGQWASPDEFTITVGGRYVREKNREFSLPYNRNMGLKIGRLPRKSGGLAVLYYSCGSTASIRMEAVKSQFRPTRYTLGQKTG